MLTHGTPRQVARAVCSTAVRGSADADAASCMAQGRGPLRALDASLVVDLAAAVLDNGWRYLTVEGAKTGMLQAAAAAASFAPARVCEAGRNVSVLLLSFIDSTR